MCRTLYSGILAGLLCAGSAQAGSFFFDFNADPVASGEMTITGSGYWNAIGGVGSSTNDSDGYLNLSYATSQSTRIIFADFDTGSVVQAFTFEADLRIGNGSQSPADGFSVNYCRANDPVLTGGDFATGQNCEANLPEEGTQTGIGIGFDAWNSGGTAGSLCNVVDQSIGTDVPAVTVRVDGTLVKQYATPTANGACNDATSIQTGPYTGDGSADGLCWAHLKVQLGTDGKLNVWWKGTQILTDYQTTYLPSPGRLVFAGRTGGSWQNQHVDNISITTIAATVAQVGSATGLADGFSLVSTDSGNSVVDPATAQATATVDGTSVAPLTASKNGADTTFTYHGFPVLLTPGSTHEVVFTCKDGNGNTVEATRSFTVPTYGTIVAADAVTGVDTTKPGYRLLPWQSPGQPNRIYWTEEQLLGLHGPNDANLVGQTNGGYMNFTDVINFNITPASNGGGDAGSFQTGAGYPDSLFPGLPSLTGLNGSSAIELLTFMKFPAAGLYTMVVNSDDGFLVTEGKNPKDRFAVRLGIDDRGKGSSDTVFTFAVIAPGIYPVRLIWENGNGESGNGANLEWFTIKDGVKYLINDPDATNTTGVAAYYMGPQLPAYVSHYFPMSGWTGCRADKLVAQITDGASALDATSVQLLVDGTSVNPALAKIGTVTTVTATFTTANMMLPGLRTATLIWSDVAGAAHSNSWTFTVANWVTLNPSLSAPLSAADATKPGFMIQMAQLDPDIARPGAGDGMANQVDSANALLGGLYFPYYASNTVDVVNGGGGGVPAAYSNVWYWNDVMDFNGVTSGGDFTYDKMPPGLPGVTGSLNNYAMWMDGYVPLNAGYYRMSVSSDDGFRVTEGLGITRHVLHVTGTGVDRDVAAVVSWTGNTSFGAPLPVVPITAPVAYFPASSGCPIPTTDLTGKIAAINNTHCYDREYVAWAQANGAIGVVLINDAQWGLPYVLGGNTPDTPITIPVVCVNGFGGEEAMWATEGLVATIGADANLQLGVADYGKGMGWIDVNFVVPQAGLYPIHVTHWQGGGGAGFEWVSVKFSNTLLADDPITRVLINDSSDASSILAYRAVTALPAPALQVVKDGAAWKIIFTGVLRAASTVNGSYDIVPGAASPYTIPTGAAGAMFYRASN